MPISLSKKKIYNRSNEIRNLIKPLSRKGNSVSCQISPSQRGSIVFGTFGGISPINMNHRDWFFKTHRKEFNAGYFEIWIEEANNFILEKAYFKLMLSENNINREVLSLHIDPNEKLNNYKKGPHLHFQTTNDIISKAHVALNLNNLNKILVSYESFNASYKQAILMINEEILKSPVGNNI